MRRAPTLIIGYGNPSRGDDVLGPAVIVEIERRMAQHPEWGPIDTVTDFQLQIEFVTDLVDRECIIFIDALAEGAKPFAFEQINAKQDRVIMTHALSPAALLTVYRNFSGDAAPPSFLLGVRGYKFELGMPLSAHAQCNLDAAMLMLGQWLTANRPRLRHA